MVIFKIRRLIKNFSFSFLTQFCRPHHQMRDRPIKHHQPPLSALLSPRVSTLLGLSAASLLCLLSLASSRCRSTSWGCLRRQIRPGRLELLRPACSLADQFPILCDMAGGPPTCTSISASRWLWVQHLSSCEGQGSYIASCIHTRALLS